MFIKIKNIKGSDYFYLVESQRIEGKSNPIPKTKAYLGTQDTAIAKLSASDYPNKDELLAKVRAAIPSVGKNQGRRGRPRKKAERAERTQ